MATLLPTAEFHSYIPQLTSSALSPQVALRNFGDPESGMLGFACEVQSPSPFLHLPPCTSPPSPPLTPSPLCPSPPFFPQVYRHDGWLITPRVWIGGDTDFFTLSTELEHLETFYVLLIAYNRAELTTTVRSSLITVDATPPVLDYACDMFAIPYLPLDGADAQVRSPLHLPLSPLHLPPSMTFSDPLTAARRR